MLMAMASLFIRLALFSLVANLCYGFNPKLLNVSEIGTLSNGGWSSARASWYGSPTGAGSEGGACGYQGAVSQPPFYSYITAGANSLYQNGRGCGTCYQVKCTASPQCSGKPITVVITDQCPGCDSNNILFDLSGTSFGGMAKPGQADQLRNVGIEQIEYKRVDCYFRGASVTFRVDPGSNPYYFSAAIEFENGDGITGAELSRAGGPWIGMQQVWGAVWKADLPSNYPPPFSVRLTNGNGKKIVAGNVIPANYSPGQTYRSVVNF